jgi:hypothetical protein
MKIYRLFALAMVCLIPCSLKAFTLIPIEKASEKQQEANAVQTMNNPSFGMMDAVGVGVGQGDLRNPKMGLQWKTPVVSPGFSLRTFSDDAAGGFDGDEYSANIGFDADIYDGLIAGVLYQRTHRSAVNALNTSENLNSDGISVYAGKRLFDILNLGLAYNFATAEHRLSRAVISNLDADSQGFTVFAGASDRKDKWSWSSTTSFAFVHDDYEQNESLNNGRFAWANTLGFDVTKEFTLGASFTYFNYVIQNVFFGAVARDNDYYTIGPRLTFYPSRDLVVHLDFDSQQNYRDYSAYTLRAGVDIGF